jgi:hypothetical protein
VRSYRVKHTIIKDSNMELLYMTRNYVIPHCQLQLDTHKTAEKVKIIFSLVWGLFSSMPFHRFHYAFAFIKYEVIKACVIQNMYCHPFLMTLRTIYI